MFLVVSILNFKETGAAHILEESSWCGSWFVWPVPQPFLGYSIFTHTSSSVGDTRGKAEDWIPKPTEFCQISSSINHIRATAPGSIVMHIAAGIPGPTSLPLLMHEALNMLLQAEAVSHPWRARTETKNEIVLLSAAPSGSTAHETLSRPCTSLYLMNFLVTRWKINPVPTCNNCPDCPDPARPFCTEQTSTSWAVRPDAHRATRSQQLKHIQSVLCAHISGRELRKDSQVRI